MKRNRSVIGSVRGDLNTPVYWIRIVTRAIENEPSCRMQVVQNIGPLVRSMCADTTRLFFKSNKHWKESIASFVHLVGRLVVRTDCRSNPKEKTAFDTLLQHEGLIGSIIQWGFWGKEYRPDIAKQLSGQDSSEIFYWARLAASVLVANAVGKYTNKRDEKMIASICTLPIISKDYDPTCMVSYVAGLIQVRKKFDDGLTREGLESELQVLVATCFVDKGVIKEMIDFGLNNTIDFSSAKFAVGASYFMVLQKTKDSVDKKTLANDTRVAFAVRSGLIEMCMSIIERFGQSRMFCAKKGNEQSTFEHLHGIIETVYQITLHKKTSKAIASKRGVIEKELLRLRGRDLPNSDYEKLLYMIRCILDISGAYCCRCNKSLSRTEVLQCNGCSGMVYCSKSCQKEDWLNGHSLTCNKLFANGQQGIFQGRLPSGVLFKDTERATSKLEELEINITMIQLKLFLDNANEIKRQASSLGIPLYDCVVEFDLGKCPPTVKTMGYTSKFMFAARKQFEETRSKDNITCTYWSRLFNGDTSAGFNLFTQPIEINKFIAMQRLFPHEWLSKKIDK